jgi:hypothetical protein
MTKKAGTQNKSKSISEKFIDQFYSIRTELYDEKGQKIEVPESGFLGLLATGYKGLSILRNKRGQTHLYAKFTKGKKVMKNRPKAGAVKRKENS